MFSKKEYSQMQATASIADNQSFALAPNLRVQHPSLEQASDSKLSPSDPNVPATTTPTERDSLTIKTATQPSRLPKFGTSSRVWFEDE